MGTPPGKQATRQHRPGAGVASHPIPGEDPGRARRASPLPGSRAGMKCRPKNTAMLLIGGRKGAVARSGCGGGSLSVDRTPPEWGG